MFLLASHCFPLLLVLFLIYWSILFDSRYCHEIGGQDFLCGKTKLVSIPFNLTVHLPATVVLPGILPHS